MHSHGLSEWRPIKASDQALRTVNPIRMLMEKLAAVQPQKQPVMSLSIGDPTIFGNFRAPDNVTSALRENAVDCRFNGYAHSAGLADSRKAIAKKYSTSHSTLSQDDIFICSSCSGALEISISALANPGQNILLPAPGFSLYQTICASKGIHARYYKLIPERNWEIDFQHLQTLIDHNTVAILVNNPSNPCGSVYSRSHLTELLALARVHQLPILSDDVYSEMVFPGVEYVSLAEISTDVPIISVGGMAKRYMVPGWRVGWIVLHDRHNVLRDIRGAILRLTMIILGANTLAQSVIPEALNNTPPAYYKRCMLTLAENARFVYQALSRVPCLQVVEPHGAMYIMVGLRKEMMQGIADDVEFVEKLYLHQGLLVLPAYMFQKPDFFRLVISAPKEVLVGACERIEEFCRQHMKT